jgi:hypothetical protein
MKSLLRIACAVLFIAGGGVALSQDGDTYERAPINYSKSAPNEAVARLRSRIASGELTLGKSDREVVRTLLRELNIPIESQLLVFSKTSLQRQRITPDHPRSLFFSDTCYVGWVPSGLIEVTAIDPLLGPVFYALDPAAARTNAGNCLVRDNDCLRCHGGTFIRDIPGLFVRSVFADETGEPLLRFGSELVDFRTAFTNRWGGWYVTGLHGTALHRGNVIASEKRDLLQVDFKHGANVTNLSGFFDNGAYLTNTSDIVALLVFEHQLAMQNTLTRCSMLCRRMLDYQANLQRELKEPVTENLAYDSVKSVFAGAARDIVDDLLFKGEAELPDGIKGSDAFPHAFQSGAVCASDGSTLKELSLQGHLFKNRCSYLIYSEIFRMLPALLKNLVFDRLARALDPDAPDPRYAYLPAPERGRIAAILRETYPDIRSALSRPSAKTVSRAP